MLAVFAVNKQKKKTFILDFGTVITPGRRMPDWFIKNNVDISKNAGYGQ